MNFVNRMFVLLMISASLLMATGANPRGTVQAQTTDHGTADRGSGTTAGESTQAKIARALSANSRQGLPHRPTQKNWTLQQNDRIPLNAHSRFANLG